MKEMRPTTGKVLQALFNILGPLDNKSFLDLFSGSGQIALNACRRGAGSVCLVESERKRYGDIVKTVPEEVKCLCMDARRALARFSKNGESFDIIFADPPYMLGWGTELPQLIKRYSGVLSADGTFIFEHSEKEKADDIPGWEREERAYGSTVLTFYQRGVDL
ncbi:MAG: RsmD family RNA methyltransferase [Synergistaceae bacterium]|nr:RsmD family RNA methyltransferase [Synergistaceae bacterium]